MWAHDFGDVPQDDLNAFSLPHETTLQNGILSLPLGSSLLPPQLCLQCEIASTLTHRVDILHWQLQRQHLTVREIADYWEYFCQKAAQPLDVLCITVCTSPQSLMAEIDAVLCLDCSYDVVGASRMRLPGIYNRYAVNVTLAELNAQVIPFCKLQLHQ